MRNAREKAFKPQSLLTKVLMDNYSKTKVQEEELNVKEQIKAFG